MEVRRRVYAYPGALPEFKTLGDEKDIEPALLHALTRQESEFNPKTVSGAGAVGLMQALLPSTAKEVARTSTSNSRRTSSSAIRAIMSRWARRFFIS